MAYSYDAGTSTPYLAGLVEFNSVRLNDGTFKLTDLGGLLDGPPVRSPLVDLPSDHGSYAGTPFYSGRPFTLAGYVDVDTVAYLDPAMDDLRKAFNLTNAALQTLTVNRTGWSATRQVSARVAGPVTFTEPVDMEKKVPQRDFQIPMIAPDPFLYGSSAYSTTVALNGAAVTLPNAGDSPAWFVVQFTGPCTNPALVDNSDATQKIAFTHVLSGTLTVNTNPTGAGITVVSSGGTNYYGDLNTFTLFTVPPGGRTVLATATGVSGGATCVVSYRDAWA